MRVPAPIGLSEIAKMRKRRKEDMMMTP